MTVAPIGTRADFNLPSSNAHTILQAAINAATTGTRIIMRNSAAPYSFGAKFTFPDNVMCEGESREGVVLQMASGKNLSVLGNTDTTNGNSRIHLKNLTIDQQGTLQSGGGGMSFTGLFDSTLENILVKTSYTFNTFIGSVPGTSLTGSLTFTNGDSTVTGSSTLFTTELAVGTVIKSAAGNLQRIISITSDTSLELDRQWGWPTETSVSAKKVSANARNRILNCTFEGNGHDDNVGLGLFDDSLIQGCISHDASGYGFGPDHTNRAKFLGNTTYSNVNGIGMETCGYCVVSSNNFSGNTNNGAQLISGCYRNNLSNNMLTKNGQNGVAISYNTTSFPPSDGNSLIGNQAEANGVHGFRISGSHRTIVMGNRAANNDQYGLVTVTENSRVPDKTQIIGNSFYDDQDTKTQDRGIYILNGTNTMVTNNIAFDADHTTAGITNSGTTTTLANNVTV